MKPQESQQATRESEGSTQPGGLMLIASIALLIVGVIAAIASGNSSFPGGIIAIMIFCSIFISIAGGISLGGLFTIQPNEACVKILFGSYCGTVRRTGFHWVNPFTKKVKISMRARNLTGDKLKVNDKRGNPIEIGAVVVWHVTDTARACFDVEDYVAYVRVQSEAAVRHLATTYSYDQGENHETTLLNGGEEITAALKMELEERLSRAGVSVDETRLTHLAYAPEIASAMLRRQQAEAVIAARSKIVHGAVTMVEMALKDLSERKILNLDDERKAAMVSNLMVVLCGEAEVHPVINTGTLYS